MLNKLNGGITYRFHARDLHLVVGPTAPGNAGAIPRVVQLGSSGSLTFRKWSKLTSAGMVRVPL
jgi:hypothetical protein